MNAEVAAAIRELVAAIRIVGEKLDAQELLIAGLLDRLDRAAKRAKRKAG